MNSHPRANSYYGAKRQLLGTQGPPPAWRTNPNSVLAQNTTANGRRISSSSILGQPSEGGSKILLSRLPQDVSDREVIELFNKTVGPTKDVFLIHNSKGLPKGMAVVTFQKATDAVLARTKYNGKIVDGKRPIKIELIVDEDVYPRVDQTPITPSPQTPSLLDRMNILPDANATLPKRPKQVPPVAALASAGKPKPQPTKRKSRTRKGPARLKRKKLGAEELDRDIEEYRAAVLASPNNFIIFPPKQDLMST